MTPSDGSNTVGASTPTNGTATPTNGKETPTNRTSNDRRPVATDGGATAVEPGAIDAETRTDRGVRVWVNQSVAFAERCLRELSTSRGMLLMLVGLAAGMQLFYGVLLEDVSGVMLASTAVGTATFGAMYVCLYAFGYLLSGDLEDRRYEAYRSMPIAASADLTGRMIAGGILAMVAFALTIVAGVATGGTFAIRSLASIPIVALSLLVTCLFWMLVALPILATAENERLGEYGVPTIAVLGYIFTGFNGANVAVSPLSGDLLNYLPNTLATRLLIYHLVPASDWTEAGLAPPGPPAGPEYLLLLVAYAAVVLAVGTVVTNRVLYDRGWWP